MSENLASKLLESDAVESLVTEQRVADDMRELGWTAVHGFFYLDSGSGKYREVDVAASTTWTIGRPSLSDLVTLNLVVECKSSKDSNLLVSRFIQPEEWMRGHYYTPGEFSAFDKVVDFRLRFKDEWEKLHGFLASDSKLDVHELLLK